jgi:polyisoprenoid-binding protein YceI
VSRLSARWLVLAAMVLAPLRSAHAAPEWFQIDPVHTRVLFFVEHARFARSIGWFRSVEGGLWFDPDDWTASRIELCLPVASLDMGDRAWERTLFRPDFLDAGRHPQACLRSTRVERLDDRRGRLHGELSLRGVAVPVVFEFTVNDLRRFSLTLKRRLGISARAMLSRAAFGIERDRTLIGDEVELMVELEAQVAPPPGTADTEADTDTDTDTDTEAASGDRP